MSTLPSRVQDVDGDNNFSPISGLEDIPLHSLGDAVKEAQKDTTLKGKNFSVNVSTALLFARSVVASNNPHNLTLDEIACIQLYTQESALQAILNQRLRDRDRHKLKPFLPLVSLFLSALYKLPPKAATVYRGKRQDMKASFKEGDMKIWWTFSSTTANLSVLQSDRFLGKKGPRTQFIIEACHAYDISMYSAFADEEELLLPPNSVLSVKSVLDAGNGLLQVVLKQQHYQSLQLKIDVTETMRPEEVVAIMRAHSSNAALQLRGCAALRAIIARHAFGSVETAEAAQQVVEAGGIEAAVAAMRDHASHAEIQSEGCHLLIHMDRGRPALDIAKTAAKAGVIEAILPSVMKGDVNACRFLSFIAGCLATSGMGSMVGSDAVIKAVADMMRSHAGNLFLEYLGCNIFWNIACDWVNRPAVVRYGGLEAIVAAMKRHVGGDGFDLQRTACGALWRISTHDGTRPLVATSEQIELVVAAMRRHADDEIAQREGSLALKEFAHLGDESRRLIAEAGGVEVLVAAKKKFSSGDANKSASSAFDIVLKLN